MVGWVRKKSNDGFRPIWNEQNKNSYTYYLIQYTII